VPFVPVPIDQVAKSGTDGASTTVMGSRSTQYHGADVPNQAPDSTNISISSHLKLP